MSVRREQDGDKQRDRCSREWSVDVVNNSPVRVKGETGMGWREEADIR